MGGSSLKDQALTAVVRDVLHTDHRLGDARLALEVRGGVVHVEGQAESDEQRQLVREVLSRVRGVHAVWDRITIPGDGRLQIVDLGCGSTKQCPGSIGMDRWASPAVDIVADFEGSLPLADRSIDRIYAIHVLEHVHHLLELMSEMHRVLKPSGVLHVMVPNWSFVNALADPTHVRFFHPQTFKYFCRPVRSGRVYKPLAVSATVSDIFVDLQPVDRVERDRLEACLSLWFDG